MNRQTVTSRIENRGLLRFLVVLTDNLYHHFTTIRNAHAPTPRSVWQETLPSLRKCETAFEQSVISCPAPTEKCTYDQRQLPTQVALALVLRSASLVEESFPAFAQSSSPLLASLWTIVYTFLTMFVRTGGVRRRTSPTQLCNFRWIGIGARRDSKIYIKKGNENMTYFSVGLLVGFVLSHSVEWILYLFGRDELSVARTALRNADSIQRSTRNSDIVDMGDYNLNEFINAAYLEKMAYQVCDNDGCSAIELVRLEGYPDVLTEEVVSKWIADKRQAGYTADGSPRRGARAFRLQEPTAS